MSLVVFPSGQSRGKTYVPGWAVEVMGDEDEFLED